jgi:cobalamin biosynthesis Mg chelatase CobN
MLIQYDGTAATTAMGTKYVAYIRDENNNIISTVYAQEYDLFWHLDQVWNNGPDAGVLAEVITVARTITIDQTFLNYLTAAGGDPIQKMLTYVEPVTPVTPTTPGTSSTTTSGTGFAAISGALSNALNGLTTGTSTATTTATTATTTEIAPGLPLGQTSTSSSNLPVGAILGAIFLIIAAIIVYLGRNTIIATLTGHGRPGK